MYTFHTTIHAIAAVAAAKESVNLGGIEYPSLAISPESLAATTFACGFEESSERLCQLERMYCEPDGSFVWVSSQKAPPWQIDGNLYDRGQRLIFVDVKGSCPAEQFDQLLKCFGWPETGVMFQLVHEAVWLDEMQFRRWANVPRKTFAPGER